MQQSFFVILFVIGSVYSRGQRAKRACLHAHLATAVRVKYPAALQRYKFDARCLQCGLCLAATVQNVVH